MEVIFAQEKRMISDSYLMDEECEVSKWQLQPAGDQKASTVFLSEKAPFSFLYSLCWNLFLTWKELNFQDRLEKNENDINGKVLLQRSGIV